MIITRLNIISFGKFSDTVFDLSAGFNIFFGNNEAGKTTVADFIRAMLYGFGDKRGTGLSLREKYIPWNGVCMEGSLTLEADDGKRYTIYRKSGESKKYDVLKIYNELSEEIKCSVADIFPVPEAMFFKALCIRQNMLSVDAPDAALIQKLSKLSENGDEELSAEKATALLKSFRSDIKATRGRRGKLYEIEDEIARINAAAEKGRALKAALYSAQKNAALAQAAYESALSDEKEPDTSASVERARIEGILEEKRKMLSAAQSLPEASPTSREKKHLGLYAVVAVLLTAALIISFVNSAAALCVPLALVGAGLLLYWRRRHAVYLRAMREKEEKAAAHTAYIHKLTGEISALEDECRALAQKTQEDNSRAREYARRLEEKRAAAAAAQTELRLAEERAEGATEDSPDNLYEKRTELLFELNCAELAENALQAAFDDMRRNFTPGLNRRASEYFSVVTGGKYPSLSVDRAFNLSVSDGVVRSAEAFSGGTVDQMYFSLRTALSDMLFENTRIFVILDQPFFQYDDERRAAALSALQALSASRQILLFSCDSRELCVKNANILKL